MFEKTLLRVNLSILFLLAEVAISAQRIVISGYILDSRSGEPLISATVRNGNGGSVSNNFGYYSITIPGQDRDVEFSYVGYASQRITVGSTKDTVINVRLVPHAEISGASVVADTGLDLHSTLLGANDISISQIKATPSVLGEADILKTVQLLPGVQHGTNGFTGLYVRGGGPDENLILLDGVPLYNVDHMAGIFSILMPESVKKVVLYKSSFPARYGGRVSSVLDVRTNDGNAEKMEGTVGVSLLSSKFHMEGPLADSSTTYSLSARLMPTILLQPAVPHLEMDDKYNYYFYDINAKVTHRFGPDDKVYLNVYNGLDKLFSCESQSSEQTEGYFTWGNTLASIRWNHLFGSRLFVNTTLAYNRYRMNTVVDQRRKDNVRYGSGEREVTDIVYGSGIHDANLMLDFDYMPGNIHYVRFGAGATLHKFHPESMEITQCVEDIHGVRDTLLQMSANEPIRGSEFYAYIEDEVSISRRFSLNAGVHFDLMCVEGRTWFSPQPRISARYSFGENMALKAGYSRMSQNIHLLSSTQITLPMDLWVPVTSTVRPVRSDQYSIGFYDKLSNGWDLSIEGYYKSMQNVLEYKDGVTMIGNTQDWQDKVEMGEGRAYGLEFLAQKNMGDLTGWIAYTLAKSERRFPDGSINKGVWFPYKYDRRHQLHLVMNYKFTPAIDAACTWSLMTGGVLTVPERGTMVLNPNGNTWHQTEYLSGRGNCRLPVSHQMNVGVNFRKKKTHGERVWTVSIYNLYNYMSPDIAMLDIKKGNAPRDGWYENKEAGYESTVRIKTLTILPLIPSVGYTYNF